MSNVDIIKGAILGHVIGDMAGVPVEFVPREKLLMHPVDQILSNGTHHMPKGTWSDDSSMMLCTLISIIEKPGSHKAHKILHTSYVDRSKDVIK